MGSRLEELKESVLATNNTLAWIDGCCLFIDSEKGPSRFEAKVEEAGGKLCVLHKASREQIIQSLTGEGNVKRPRFGGRETCGHVYLVTLEG